MNYCCEKMRNLHSNGHVCWRKGVHPYIRLRYGAHTTLGYCPFCGTQYPLEGEQS